MKKLSNSTIIGKKRKKIAENKENEKPQFPVHSKIQSPGSGNGLQQSNHYVFGVFENSINSPLSIITHSGILVKSSITCTKKLCQGERSNKGKYDGQCSLCPPTHTNSNPLRSNLSFDYCRNLEDEFAQVLQETTPVTCGFKGNYLPNCSLETNCIMQRSEKRTHESPQVVCNLEELFLNVDRVNDAYDPLDAVTYHDIGDPTNICEHCNAIFWFEERVNKSVRNKTPKYSSCCGHGKIKLPKMRIPPKRIFDLFFTKGQKQKEFLQHIRRYNNMFSFTSLGAKVDKSINIGNSPPIFRINGQNFHLMGGLLPQQGNKPKFAQLYIHDTENEVENRINAFSLSQNIDQLHVTIVEDIKQDLDDHNVLVKSFRLVRNQIQSNPRVEFKMRLIGKRNADARTYNLPSVSEVAALIVGDLDPTMGQRDILVESNAGGLKRINELNPAYLPLQYPILFPYGEDGYREDIQFNVTRNQHGGGRVRVSQREFFAFRIHERLNEVSTMLYARRLFQQFLVDAYTMVESSRLLYIRNNQKALRCEAYKGLSDALTRGEVDTSKQGKRIILPSSFTCGARYMIQNYQDAMAICRHKGYPNLFITFTCNPKWPEIQRYMQKCNLKAEDRPDIICRIFKLKLDSLVKEIRSGNLFGVVTAVVYTIEFQKRGLPHAHILIFLQRLVIPFTSETMDNFISAEIPDKEVDIDYYQAVQEFMIHGPCGIEKPKSPCMVNNKCSKHFPKKFVDVSTLDDDGYPIYKRRDNGKTVEKNGVQLDNRYVVPHNRYLLLKYKAHINVEWCNQSRSIKYLFKYVNKGNDRVTAEFYRSTTDERSNEVVDEISMYYDCRYVSACEAAWRLLSFDVQFRHPPVERLSFHLPDCQSVVFEDDDRIENVLNRPTVNQSMFTAWFDANKKFDSARALPYIDMPTKFVWKKDIREWHPRQRGFAIGRIFYVPPGSGEIYYLRCLLNVVRGPTNFEDIKSYKGVIYPTFRDVCYARGLLDDDQEYIDAINEASQWATAAAMRKLFVILLTSNLINRPENVWNEVWHHLSEDVQYNRRRVLQDRELCLSDDDKKNLALIEIERLLQLYNKTLSDYPHMPTPNYDSEWRCDNRLLFAELNYDRVALRDESELMEKQLTDEQTIVYDTILHDIQQHNGGLYFVYGYGGTWKTFVWKALSAKIRSQGDIVINVASSGIASLLLPGGRTAHSRFAIPIGVTEDSTCNIAPGSHLAELIVKCKLIIWDEAPMMHKHCFEALDRTLRDLLRFSDPHSNKKTFGGKTVVLGGDFRQILPVVPKGSRQDIVSASINSSYLWDSCKVLRLTKNLRLNNREPGVDMQKVEQFASWLAAIGDGTMGGPNDGYANVEIPNEMLLPSTGDHIATIVDSIFPMFKEGCCQVQYMESRAILAPTLDVVNAINEYMTNLHVAESKTYLSWDTVCKSDSSDGILNDMHTPEFLNGLKASGIPNHALTLKVGSPVMLLRNIDHSMGLCNGTRLIITRLSDHVVEAKIVTGNNADKIVLIPRMSMTPTDTRLPFKFQRRQFPLMLSYAMTINKSQGQTLTHVGLLLRKPVFVHGQLYVAASRISNPKVVE
ncbi:uncharacterized protein LOC116027603 [Ipomoea triloba]|uniref:uncharacterized protein LOC116027603 n=1 Tax=Ipomoea triloba TaxID=35885 RepID=UPI00125DB012|nr:uncharacterized protein LOC116027603 [Ipomoea triloba]